MNQDCHRHGPALNSNREWTSSHLDLEVRRDIEMGEREPRKWNRKVREKAAAVAEADTLNLPPQNDFISLSSRRSDTLPMTDSGPVLFSSVYRQVETIAAYSLIFRIFPIKQVQVRFAL